MKGVISLPLLPGKRELSWYVGSAITAGLNTTNPVVPLKVERDADFVAKRVFLVQWPPNPGGVDPDLALPATTLGQMKDGATSRGLSLSAISVRALFNDANRARMIAAQLGLPCPFLIRANNNVFVELANPSAATLPWTGNLFLVMEGFKVYPDVPEDFPSTIKSYAVPFDLSVQQAINSPAAAVANITGQTITLTNNGEGKMLVKGMKVRVIDANGVDQTDALLPWVGFNIIDSTSGNKYWAQNTQSVLPGGRPFVPAQVMTLAGTFMPWCSTRYIDPNGNVQIQVTFSDIAAAVAAVGAIGTWPMTFHVTLFGALLPR